MPRRGYVAQPGVSTPGTATPRGSQDRGLLHCRNRGPGRKPDGHDSCRKQWGGGKTANGLEQLELGQKKPNEELIKAQAFGLHSILQSHGFSSMSISMISGTWIL